MSGGPVPGAAPPRVLAIAGSDSGATTSATTTTTTAAAATATAISTAGAAEPGGWTEARAYLFCGKCGHREEGRRSGTEVRSHAHGGGCGRRGRRAWVHWTKADFVRRCHRARGQFCRHRNSFVSRKRWNPYGFSFQFAQFDCYLLLVACWLIVNTSY